MFSKEKKTIMLAHADDWVGFRRAARRLLHAGVAPESIHWCFADDAQKSLDLFGGNDACSNLDLSLPIMDDAPEASSGVYLPRMLFHALSLVILHRAPDRLHCLYRFLWRWRHEPTLRNDPLDPDVKKINDYSREVWHDAHRMLGFVRFRLINTQRNTASEKFFPGSTENVSRVAWYAPRHRILRLTAPFFAQRFSNHRWGILTPDASVLWDTRRLTFHPGVTAADMPPPDAGEALWLAYYANQFNAARRNPAALSRQMPKDYWKNLPEAGLIRFLLARR